jgi:hypothetical protein
MKAPKEVHEKIDSMFDEAYTAGLSDGKDDGWDDGYSAGSKDADKAKASAESYRASQVAAEDLLSKLTDALGWDRFDVARYRETGIMPATKERR